jgi:hypothetical protein
MCPSSKALRQNRYAAWGRSVQQRVRDVSARHAGGHASHEAAQQTQQRVGPGGVGGLRSSRASVTRSRTELLGELVALGNPDCCDRGSRNEAVRRRPMPTRRRWLDYVRQTRSHLAPDESPIAWATTSTASPCWLERRARTRVTSAPNTIPASSCSPKFDMFVPVVEQSEAAAASSARRVPPVGDRRATGADALEPAVATGSGAFWTRHRYATAGRSGSRQNATHE